MKIKKITLSVLIGGGLCALTFVGLESVIARGRDKRNIPNGGIYSCKTCHNKGSYKPENLNPFGKDYMDNKSMWDAILADKDSDGDGKTNGWELGDAEGIWKKGDEDPDPGRPIYNPGIENSNID